MGFFSGFLDRVERTLTGFGGAAQAIPGFFWDLARAPVNDEDELNGNAFAIIYDRAVNRGAQALGNLIGPQEGLGAIVGGVPEGVRAPARSVITPVLEGLDTASQELIREPLTTLITMGSLADSSTYGEGWGAFVNPDAWKDAYRMAQSTSFGQSLALSLGTRDILDQSEVNNFVGTDFYRIASGTADAFIQLFYGVDSLAGGAVMEARRANRFGAVIADVAPVLPGTSRLARYQITAPRIEAINTVIRDAYHALPPRLQHLLSPTVLQQEDVGRLAANRASEAARTGRPVTEAWETMAVARQRSLDAMMGAPLNRRRVTQILRSPSFQHFEDQLAEVVGDGGAGVTGPVDVGTAAGLIRDRFFPNHAQGDILSHFLAEAGSRSERESLVRLFMGDLRQLDKLQGENYALARRLEDLVRERTVILGEPEVQFARDNALALREAGTTTVAPGAQMVFDFDTFNYRERLDRIDEEIEAVVSQRTRTQRLDGALGILDQSPEMGVGGKLRHAIKSSDTYQNSAFGRAVRTFTDMRPHHVVDIGDSNADGQLARFMREAGWDDGNIAQWRGRFMATDLDGRSQVFTDALEATERKVMREYGLDSHTIGEILNESRRGREMARDILKRSKFDAEGRALVRGYDDDGSIFEYPLRPTELQNSIPVTNWRLLRQELERYARLNYGPEWRQAIARGAQPIHAASALGAEVLHGIMRVWKPVVLLRPAWTIRVVLMDEQFRQIAQFGALATMLGKREQFHNYGVQLRQNPRIARILGTNQTSKASRRGRVAAGAIAGGMVGGPLGAAAGAGLGQRIMSNLADIERAGVRNLTLNGYRVATPFGNPGDSAEVFRSLNSAAHGMEEFLDVHQSRVLAGLRRNPYEWRSYQWGESPKINEAYRAEWSYLMRHHFTKDPMSRMFLEGRTVDEVYDWLTGTIDGRMHAARLPGRSGSSASKRNWVNNLADQVEAYTGGSPEARAAILALADDAGPAKWNAVLDMIPENRRAPIHGRELEQIIGTSHVQEIVNGFVDTTFEVLGGMATDELSRNPTFHRFYYADMQRKLAGIGPGRISEDTLRSMENQSRRTALAETRDLLYDMAEQSQFASMTRLLMPFFPAWQEVLTRWAGLVAENPMAAIYARKIWDAPNKAQMVERDDEGNEFLVFRIPEFARGLVDSTPWLSSALDSQGRIRLDKGGFNLVASGTPGFGPFVQAAVSEAVQEVPSLEDAVRFIIPFGPQTGLQAFLPPAVKRSLSMASGEDDRAFGMARNRILITKLVQMQQGEIPMVDMDDPVARADFMEQVNDETQSFFRLRLFSSLVAPVAPIFDSPYQPYIDAYRAMERGDQATAEAAVERALPGSSQAFANLQATYGEDTDAIFLDLFGEEFFALTQSFTRSNDGVPPTVEGLEARDRFEDLIERYPEWGSVITGEDGGGMAVQFSRAAYDRQLNTAVRPGSSDKQRERLSGEEVLEGPSVRLGWTHYSRYMDQLETIRIARGLPNFQVAAAAPLRAVKQQIILTLASQYPAWYRDFSVTDRNAWDRKLQGARALAADERLSGRLDIRGLRRYLRLRDAIVAVLDQRERAGGSSVISAQQNVDISAVWETLLGRIIDEEPAFADLYYRRLERDPLRLDPLSGLVPVVAA